METRHKRKGSEVLSRIRIMQVMYRLITSPYRFDQLILTFLGLFILNYVLRAWQYILSERNTETIAFKELTTDCTQKL